MFSKNFDYRDFKRFSRVIYENGGIRFTNSIGITLKDFNKIYFGKQNVIVQSPTELWKYNQNLLGMFVGLKTASGCRVAMFNPPAGIDTLAKEVFESFAPNNVRDGYNNFVNRYPYHIIDESFVVNNDIDCYVFPFCGVEWGDNLEAIEKLENTVKFINDNHLEHQRRIVIAFPKVLNKIGSSVCAFDGVYDRLKEQFTKRFMFFDYRREREIVDRWMIRDDVADITYLDPSFDVKLMERGLNLNYVYNYMALNTPSMFKEYAELNKEEISKHMRKEDLREFIR